VQYYTRNITEETAVKLVTKARERMDRRDLRAALDGVADNAMAWASAILQRMQYRAPMHDCGMSAAADELDLWAPEMKAARRQAFRESFPN